jgi:hypothetical protein
MVKTTIWDDDYVGDLEPHGKLLWVALLTNRNSTIIGFFPVTIKNLRDDTGIPRDEIIELLGKFEKDGKLIYRDGFVLLINFIRHQALNSTVVKGILNTFKTLPKWAKDSLSIAYPTLPKGYLTASDSLSDNIKFLSSNPKGKTTHTEDTHAREEPVNEEVDAAESAGAGSGWEWPMKPLIEAFPEYLPDRVTPAMIGFIEADVKPGDEQAWADTIETYRMNFDPMLNRYLPDKTANLLGVFRKCKQELQANGSGNGGGNKAAQQRSAKERVGRVDEIIRDSDRFERPKLD